MVLKLVRVRRRFEETDGDLNVMAHVHFLEDCGNEITKMGYPSCGNVVKNIARELYTLPLFDLGQIVPRECLDRWSADLTRVINFLYLV